MKDRSLAMWGAAALAMELAKQERIAWKDVTGKLKKRRFVELRARIAKHLRASTDLSLPEIGRIIGRHHSAVIYLLRKA